MPQFGYPFGIKPNKDRAYRVSSTRNRPQRFRGGAKIGCKDAENGGPPIYRKFSCKTQLGTHIVSKSAEHEHPVAVARLPLAV